MAQQQIIPENGCCFACSEPIDPTDAERIVIAGDVCGDVPVDNGPGANCRLATIYFPSQQYRAGFEPAEALCKGTLFPELVFPFKGGTC